MMKRLPLQEPPDWVKPAIISQKVCAMGYREAHPIFEGRNLAFTRKMGHTFEPFSAISKVHWNPLSLSPCLRQDKKSLSKTAVF